MRRFKIDWFKVLISLAMILAVMSISAVLLANKAEQQQLDRLDAVEVRLGEEAQERIRLNCASIQVNSVAIIQLHNRIAILERVQDLPTPEQLLPEPPSECRGQSKTTGATTANSKAPIVVQDDNVTP